MLGTGSPLPATTPRLAISFAKLSCRPSPPGYCRSTTNVRLPRRSTVSRCTAEQTPPVNRRWPTMRLPRPIDAATQARVATEGRRCLNPPSLQSPPVMSANLLVRSPRRYGFSDRAATAPHRGSILRARSGAKDYFPEVGARLDDPVRLGRLREGQLGVDRGPQPPGTGQVPELVAVRPVPVRLGRRE